MQYRRVRSSRCWSWLVPKALATVAHTRGSEFPFWEDRLPTDGLRNTVSPLGFRCSATTATGLNRVADARMRKNEMNSTTNNPLATEFRNQHLSVSRLRLFEQCELAFYFKYVNKGDTEPRGNAAMFGVVLHAALELTYTWIVNEMYEGLFPIDRLTGFYREAWQTSQLVGVALYQEGLQILRAYAKSHDPVDHMRILAVEKEFNEDVNGYLVNGYIDRIDRLDDDHIVVVDFKSNRNLYTRDELDTDLQMSIYGLVARRLYPWAKRISFSFHMLRHDTSQNTNRTAAEIDDAAGYIVALGKRSEERRSPEDWKPTLNANCSYCDHRRRCPLYAKILASKHEVTKVANWDDFHEVAKKREELHKLAKVLYARKGELDDLIKARLNYEGEFDAGGYHYRYESGGFTKTYDPSDVIRTFDEVGVPPEVTARRVLTVSPEALESLRIATLETLGQDRRRALLLNATIEAIAKSEPNTPRLNSRATKKPFKAANANGKEMK